MILGILNPLDFSRAIVSMISLEELSRTRARYRGEALATGIFLINAH